MVLQAAVAACHATAPSYEQTDWREVVGLYDLLLEVWPSPSAELARAVATSLADGPEAGLRALDRIVAPPPGPYAPAARAYVLAGLGRPDEAREQYRTAVGLTANEQERRHLRSRLDALDGPRAAAARRVPPAALPTGSSDHSPEGAPAG